jgi:heterodisulfide reductase subunit A
MQESKHQAVSGAVLVVGGGVGGIQSALDLAEAGFKVYLVEKQPAIGGRMAQLDKTFPTGDCAMCTLAPRLVECSRHPNIQLLTCAELQEVQGEPGDFRARVRIRGRYVDTEKCTGCGDCVAVCPMETADEFNVGLGRRKAIYRPYAQSVPHGYVVDIDNCPECVKCEEACAAGAINFLMWDKEITLRVGAIILSTGYELFDPGILSEYGYGIYPNVLTSIQFERMLSASGPSGGTLTRPSDGAEPRKIAFIQCVGSRDVARGQEYCSAVCCMHATKQGMIAKERIPGLEVTVFLIDLRAFGRDFERYYERARREYGIRYLRCSVGAVKELQQNKNLLLRYPNGNGGFHEEDFDLVVLSPGLCQPEGVEVLARAAGIELNEYGFCRSSELYPGLTTRSGIFAAGVLCAPKDIPETVVEASSAAANASRLLAAARGTETVRKEFPPEKDVRGERPRIGVFVCSCGHNIGGVLDVEALAEYAKGLKDIVYTELFLFACARDSLENIRKRIEEFDLNRVVVAACTPRSHAPLFQSCLREAGLNPQLYEQVNIREQVSWVHQSTPEQANAKARDLIRMAVAKARLLEPVSGTFSSVNSRALVVGGGVAGMTAALSLAEQGYPVTLVEKSGSLGGNLRRLFFTLEGSAPQDLLHDLITGLENHPLVEILTWSEVVNSEGHAGNYRTTVACVDDLELKEIEHGVVIVATGAVETSPKEYFYGVHPDVMTQTELEKILGTGGFSEVGTVVMIQCVGSRNEERPYCSRICCAHALKNALKIKEVSPATNVFILYRDIRAYGFMERYYRLAREKGVLFIRYEPENKPVVTLNGKGLQVRITDPVLGRELVLDTDLIALSAAIEPRKEGKELARLFKVPLTADGFLAEAHVKLRPVDLASEGMYVCGLAHGPKMLGEAVAQAGAAAIRAVTLLSKDRLEGIANVASIDEQLCSGCGLCIDTCPYGAREIDVQRRVATVNRVLCQGCGVCVAICPTAATQQHNFSDEQIMAQITAALR